MRFGYATLGDHLTDPVTGRRETQAERHRSIVEAAVLAESVGFDGVYLGEHHFCQYILSTPPVVLAAIAERTTTMTLSTAVTLAANNDPVRLAEDYSTLDILSGGRVEIVVGRGNLYEHTFRGFGQDAEQSQSIFDEYVELLSRLLREEQIEWTGAHRAPFERFTTQPRPATADGPPLWLGGGSSRSSLELAIRLGLPLMLPTVVGPPAAFTKVVERYRALWAAAGRDPADAKVGMISHINVMPDHEAARARITPRMKNYWGFVTGLVEQSSGRELPGFDSEWYVSGPTIAGSPAHVVDRIGSIHELLEHDLHLLMFDMGGAVPEDVSEMIELAGAEVLPALRSL